MTLVTWIVTIVITAFVFAIFGVVASVYVYSRHYNNPENMRALLKRMYRKSHPHWAQISPEDATRVCPCCGWSETESIAAP